MAAQIELYYKYYVQSILFFSPSLVHFGSSDDAFNPYSINIK
jgi:hypothetical protein